MRDARVVPTTVLGTSGFTGIVLDIQKQETGRPRKGILKPPCSKNKPSVAPIIDVPPDDAKCMAVVPQQVDLFV